MVPHFGYNGEKLMAEVARLQLLRRTKTNPVLPKEPAPTREHFGMTWAPLSTNVIEASLPVSPMNFECYAHRKIGGMCDELGFRHNSYSGTNGRLLTANSYPSSFGWMPVVASVLALRREHYHEQEARWAREWGAKWARGEAQELPQSEVRKRIPGAHVESPSQPSRPCLSSRRLSRLSSRRSRSCWKVTLIQEGA